MRSHLLEKKFQSQPYVSVWLRVPKMWRPPMCAVGQAPARPVGPRALKGEFLARVKRAVHGRKHHRAVLEAAQGYYGNKSRSFRAANEQVMHSLMYAFRDRRAKKGEFRRLWIQRVNAACRANGMSYSRFIAGLKAAEVEVDRKVLADIAVRDEAAFSRLVEVAREALSATVAATASHSRPG